MCPKADFSLRFGIKCCPWRFAIVIRPPGAKHRRGVWFLVQWRGVVLARRFETPMRSVIARKRNRRGAPRPKAGHLRAGVRRIGLCDIDIKIDIDIDIDIDIGGRGRRGAMRRKRWVLNRFGNWVGRGGRDFSAPRYLNHQQIAFDGFGGADQPISNSTAPEIGFTNKFGAIRNGDECNRSEPVAFGKAFCFGQGFAGDGGDLGDIAVDRDDVG